MGHGGLNFGPFEARICKADNLPLVLLLCHTHFLKIFFFFFLFLFCFAFFLLSFQNKDTNLIFSSSFFFF